VRHVLRGTYLAALGPSLRPSDQLRHRTTSSLPALPAAGRSQVNRRARKTPATLWPTWAVRLSPPDGAYPRRRTGVTPGQGRRDKMARCLLFARVSGLPVEAAPDFGTAGGEA
jgi:hypothetical protein